MEFNFAHFPLYVPLIAISSTKSLFLEHIRAITRKLSGRGIVDLLKTENVGKSL